MLAPAAAADRRAAALPRPRFPRIPAPRELLAVALPVAQGCWRAATAPRISGTGAARKARHCAVTQRRRCAMTSLGTLQLRPARIRPRRPAFADQPTRLWRRNFPHDQRRPQRFRRVWSSGWRSRGPGSGAHLQPFDPNSRERLIEFRRKYLESTKVSRKYQCGTPARRPMAVVPASPWCTTARQAGKVTAQFTVPTTPAFHSLPARILRSGNGSRPKAPRWSRVVLCGFSIGYSSPESMAFLTSWACATCCAV